MAKVRHVSGEDRVLADGRLVRVDEVVEVANPDSYTCQEATWEAVSAPNRKES